MLASCAALVRASRCGSEQSVGTVMTAALMLLPRKSDAEETRRRRWRVVISETVTRLGESDSVSCIEKATVPLCSEGCAEAWLGVGSIDLKLQCRESAFYSIVPTHWSSLFAQVISKVRNRILAVAYKLCLCLCAMVFLSLNV